MSGFQSHLGEFHSPRPDESSHAPTTKEANASADRKKLDPQTPLQFVPGIGPLRLELFHKLGIRKPLDLLFLFPRTYQDIAPYQSIAELVPGVRATVVGQIVDLDQRFGFDGRSTLGVLLAVEGGGYVRCVWYNQMFRRDHFHRGMTLVATGVPKSTGISFEMRHPEFLVLGDRTNLPAPRPTAIYPLTEGLSQKHIAAAVEATLEDLLPFVEEALPDRIRSLAAGLLFADKRDLFEQHSEPLLGIAETLRRLHLPVTLEEADQARLRLIFQELLVYQLAIAMRRYKLQLENGAPSLPITPQLHARILKRIPFKPTGDQLRVMEEVRADIERTIPMNRLVQGDVGSGKTVIAHYAMLATVANKHQTALMAPTELLARQHFEKLQKQLAGSQVMVELLVGSLGTREQHELQQRIAIGTVDIVVGTQALLSQHVQFHSLGLVVIDEQHKFGVEQRAALREGRVVPHYLVLSATPIPRSITMTLFGDLDVSILREKPPGRARVHTYLGEEQQKSRWWDFVRKQLQSGRQAYVVIPRVESDEENEMLGAEQVFADLSENELADFHVELLHGRMDGEEKQQKLNRFQSGETQVLIATTVVEVGIDVPNATLMAILDADRLGLAQLHQLRGRVSRGQFPGYVCLFPSKKCEPLENERLQSLIAIDDGFRLAEEDLRLRGTGDLLGTKQVGAPAFRIADLSRDGEILSAARKVAQELVTNDPDLHAPDLAKLKKLVLGRHGNQANLGDVG
ncbi:ATP-dependent DNA helicase RecG [Pirellulaceae bacterium SH467]